MVTSLNYPLGGASRHCLYHTSVFLTVVLLLTRCTTGLHHQSGGPKTYSHQRISHHQQQSARSEPTGMPGASTSADGLAAAARRPVMDRGEVPRHAYNPQADASQGSYQGGFNSTLDGPQALCQEGKGGCNYGAGLDMRAISLEKIKQDILRKLKLDETRLPNISSKTSPIAEYLSEVMEMPRDMPPTETFDDDEAAEQTIIAFSKIQPLKLSAKESQDLYYFSFSDGKLVNMRVESAVLYIQVNITPSTPVQYPGMHFRAHPMEKKFTNFTIRITQHIPQQKKNESPVQIDYGYFKPVFRPSDDVTETPMKYDGTRWIMVDVRDEILKWIAAAPGSSAKKVGLLIEAVSPDDEISKDVKIVGSDDPDGLSAASVNHNPFFKLNLKEKPKTRHARDVSMVCDENSAETRCCRYPLTVDFEEFGWDFIIAPKRYDAYYCSGECPPAFLQTYPHNHIVQQALPSGVGGPCCAARKLSPISMLYFDADMTIIYSTLPGMIVDRCGCT